MKKTGMLMLMAGAAILIFAWAYPFPGMVETHQSWDAQNNRWSAPQVTRDDKMPLRWMFTGVAVAVSAAGTVLIGLPRKRVAACIIGCVVSTQADTIAAAALPEQTKNSQPQIWDLRISQSKVQPPSLTFSLQFEAGKAEIKVGKKTSTRLWVGIGPFGAVESVIKAGEKDLSLVSRLLTMYKRDFDIDVVMFFGAGLALDPDDANVLKADAVFRDVKLGKPKDVDVTVLLVDETGNHSNPIKVVVDFEKGIISANLLGNSKPSAAAARGPHAALFAFPETIRLTRQQQTGLNDLMTKYVPELQELDKKRDAIVTPARKKANAQARQKALDDGKSIKEAIAASNKALGLTPPEAQALQNIDSRRGQLLREIRDAKQKLLIDEQKKALKDRK